MPFVESKTLCVGTRHTQRMGDSDADMVAKVAGGNRGGLDALKTDKPPTWDGKKTSYTAWWYLMYPFLLLCRLGPLGKAEWPFCKEG